MNINKKYKERKGFQFDMSRNEPEPENLRGLPLPSFLDNNPSLFKNPKDLSNVRLGQKK